MTGTTLPRCASGARAGNASPGANRSSRGLGEGLVSSPAYSHFAIVPPGATAIYLMAGYGRSRRNWSPMNRHW